MSINYVVTHKGIIQMRGDLAQANAFLISRFGSVDNGISAGAKILPEWLANPPSASGNFSPIMLHTSRYGNRPNYLFSKTGN